MCLESTPASCWNPLQLSVFNVLRHRSQKEWCCSFSNLTDKSFHYLVAFLLALSHFSGSIHLHSRVQASVLTCKIKEVVTSNKANSSTLCS